MAHAFFAHPTPLAFAHRGGAKRWPENTLASFAGAAGLGFRYIETDIHQTADGHLVCFHDESLDRTTNGSGLLQASTLAELQRLDAAYRFLPEEGFPFRGQGLTVPTLQEALAIDPQMRFVLEIKPPGPAVAAPLWHFIEQHGIHDRVLVASQHDSAVDHFRSLCGGSVPTSAGQRAIRSFWWRARLGLSRWSRYNFQALQVPPRYEDLEVVTRRFVDAAHRHGIQVHVWTIDDRAEMERLLSLGVDGIMTDTPELLQEVLSSPRK